MNQEALEQLQDIIQARELITNAVKDYCLTYQDTEALSFTEMTEHVLDHLAAQLEVVEGLEEVVDEKDNEISELEDKIHDLRNEKEDLKGEIEALKERLEKYE